MDRLRLRLPAVTASQVRWALSSGKVSRPRLDGSLRFDFAEQNVRELLAYFASDSRRRVDVPRDQARTQDATPLADDVCSPS
jgi:hypothetical protein